MMFETEESGKRRYMGTIVGVSDLDPLRWSGSKWRNLQVEWDEPGCSDKQNRVSAWEIETPESLFIFPSLTAGLKRPMMHSGFLGADASEWASMKRPFIPLPEYGTRNLPYSSISHLCSEQMMKLMKPQQHPVTVNQPKSVVAKGAPLEEVMKRPQFVPQQNTLVENPSTGSLDQPETAHRPNKVENQSTLTENIKSEPKHVADQLSHINEDINQQNLMTFHGQSQSSLWPMLPQLDSMTLNGILPYLNTDEWASQLSNCQPITGMYRTPVGPPLSMFGMHDTSPAVFPKVLNSPPGQDMWDRQLNGLSQVAPFLHEGLPAKINSNGISDESNNRSEIYVGGSIGGIDSSTILEDFCMLKDPEFHNPSDCLVVNFSSSQDVQSQITSASLADSQAFSRADNSGGTSSSNVDFDESSFLQNSSWQQVSPRTRTYTKVQKAGSVGRSIDVTSFKNYEELCCAIECMFGLEGLLNDPRGSGWKLVYVDYENDVLLIGDDPWEEFVGCVRCIRILSPTEVQQMSEEGMKLLNSAAMQGIGAEV
jgi:auxin response factor